MSSYARQGFHYNRNRLSQSNATRDAENGSLISVGGGGRERSVKNNGQRNPPPRAGGIQRFSRQNRIMALSQNDDQGGQEIMVDHAGGEFALSQETEITLTQALQEPDKKQQRSRSSGAKNDDHRTSSSQHRHLAGRTPRAMGGRGVTMVGRGGLQHHRASTPSNQKRRQMQQNIQLSQKNHHHRMNPNSVVGNNHHGNFTTPVAGGGRLLSSSKSVSSRNNGLLLSQSMQEEDDDTSTIQSRTLLTQDSQGGGGSRFGGQRQQQSMKRSTLSGAPHNNGQQQQQQRATMSITSNTTQQGIPSLASSRRPVSTAVRTLGGISTTLATLATPSKAFRSMTSFAARTAARTGATLGLTPCNFRSRSAVLSSSRLSSSGARAAASGGVRMATLSSKPVGGANGVLVKRPEEEEDDDASKVTQKTYDPNDEKDNGGSVLAAQKEAAANDEKKKVEDFLAKVQSAMDDKMKQFDEKLDEKFTEKKNELNEFFEKTAKTFKESVSKIEDIQQAMDGFPAKIASSTQEHGAQIRQLVAESRGEMEKESVRVVESISSKARAVADDEAKKSILEVVNNVIATAKGDFQVWTEGVLAGMRSSVIGDRRPVAAVSGEESTSDGPNDSIETEDCEVKGRCQQSTVFSERVEWNKSDKENVLPDAEEEETTLREEVDDVETNCSTVETQFCADVQSGKWSDEEEDITEEKEEILKKGATPFSPKATPSTSTTPFSRKTTPVKNNYGKNRKSMQSSRAALYDDDDNNDELKPEVRHRHKVQNNFGVAMSPHSKHIPSSKKKQANRASPSSPQIPLKLSSDRKKRRNSPLPLSPRIDNRKVKSAKKAPKCELKHKIKAKPHTQQKPPRYSQASKDESTQSSKVKVQQKNSNDFVDKQPTKMKRKAPKKTDTAPRLSQHSETRSGRSQKSDSIHQLSQRSEQKQAESAPQIPQRSNKKRDQSNVTLEKSTRRSKRLKESTRAAKASLKTRTEQAALKTKNKKAKAAKAKQVTPVDDGARQLQSIAAKKGPSNTISSFHNPTPFHSNDDDQLDAELHTYPANDADELLGKELLVVAENAPGDDSSGLDPDDCLLDKSKEKLVTPFQTGGSRRSKKKSYGRKSKAAIAMHAGKNKPEKVESVFSFKW